MTDQFLRDATEHWREINAAIGEAFTAADADPYCQAALLDARAGCWLRLGALRGAAEPGSDQTDVYTVACHYAAILDQEQAARIRFGHSIPTLHPGSVLAHLRLEEKRCGTCGRLWQVRAKGACQKCPRLLWGISPASAGEVAKYPPGTPWEPSGEECGES